MAFFDKLGEITKSVGDKTNDMIEDQGGARCD